MERSMEIKLVSARDLNNVNLLMKMDVYAVIKLVAADAAGKSKPKSGQKFTTPVDKEGGSNPIWNFSVKFAVDEAVARANCLTIVFKLRCQRNLGDKDIGDVYVPVKELLDSAGEGKGDLMQHLSYQVRKPSGNPQGVLNFAFKFGDNFPSGPTKPDPVQSYNPVPTYLPSEPSSVPVSHGGFYPPPPPPPPPQPEVYPPPSKLYPVLPPKLAAPEIGFSAYPPPQPAIGYSMYPPTTSYNTYAPAPSYSGYAPPPTQQPEFGYSHQPPPPHTAAYGYPPPTTYGYPPPPSYYPPPPQNKKSNMGLGLGAGLVGGMLGGLLIGDMVSDAADGGFGDSVGFDF